jgi:hypothetical protein
VLECPHSVLLAVASVEDLTAQSRN